MCVGFIWYGVAEFFKISQDEMGSGYRGWNLYSLGRARWTHGESVRTCVWTFLFLFEIHAGPKPSLLNIASGTRTLLSHDDGDVVY